MRLLTRVWFWLLAIPLLLFGSLIISFGVVTTLDRVFGGSALNVWGDMEGLIGAFWMGAVMLFVAGLSGLIAYLRRAHQPAGSA